METALLSPNMKFNTKTIHGGQEPEKTTGAVVPPIFQTSTFAQFDAGENQEYNYSRGSNPTRTALEKSFASLENGTDGFAFSSGLAAIDCVLRTLKPGDEIIASNELYGGTYRMFTKLFQKYGLEFTYVNMDSEEDILKAISDKTKLVWLETPTNPLIKIGDIKAISSAVKEVFMGSSTIKVIKNFNYCPIVAVPASYAFNLPKKIAFATNFEHTYTTIELVPLISIAQLYNSEIIIVHVDKGIGLSTEQENCKKLLNKRLNGLRYRFEEVNGANRISEAIMDYASKTNTIELIGMINYWHSFFEKLTKENVIKRLAFHTEVPFLIFPLID